MTQEKIPTRVLSFFWFFVKKQKLLFFFLLIATSIAWPLQEAIFPYIHKLLIENIVNFHGAKTEIFSVLKPTLLMGFAILLISDLCFRLQDFLYAKILPKFCGNIRMAIFDYCQFHSMRYFSNSSTGVIANKINAMPEIAENIIRTLFILIWPIFLTIMISTVFLFKVKAIFGFIWLAWFSFHMILTLVFMKNYSHLSMKHANSVSVLSGKIVDVLINISSVKLFSRHKYEFDLLQQSQKREITDSFASHKYKMFIKTILNLASTSLIVSMILLSLYCWQQNFISLPEIVLVMSYLRLSGLVWYLGENIVMLFSFVGAAKNSLTLIREPHKVTDSIKAKDVKFEKGEINFENVSFQYAKSKSLFENCSLSIPDKQKVGLVGFSGSGKTTFINLILRYFDVTSGIIKIDGHDISKIQQESLRKQISVIPQDPILFNRSIINNIRYGRLDASDHDVFEAAEKAYAHEFIMELPDGYDSVLGEKFVNLSGGQKQRIAIARAILKNAPILILDEATSSLDSFTEELIQKAFNELMNDKTVIAIAHRISTLLNMDRILVFDKGQIVEDGSHEELLNKKGFYWQLWNKQSDGFIPES